MAWYPGATRMELQPESDKQNAIRPTQLIMHSIAAPWDERRMYEYWRDSTNLESHFGLDYDGSIGQFIGTETRADANYRANERPDGTGAVSIETASNLKHTDAWTPEQMEQLIRLGVWLHQRHGIPLRICRSATDPGFGYHRLHSAWAVSGTDCPGDARVQQFREVVFPGIVARATGQTTPPPEEDDVPLTDAEMRKIAQYSRDEMWGAQWKSPTDPDGPTRSAATFARWADVRHQREMELLTAIRAEAGASLTSEQLATLADKVASHPVLAEQIAELVADKLAARLTD
ncbi:N-acetylmuramoyl-L-alanine amidase [Streptomyces sp. NPDC008121]|uniref:peptidoglycan recognition protein family protein n=1 Tax=Streptomyces sp. NPDC008121 TaxID=3364809 RepID=UPI0036E4D384